MNTDDARSQLERARARLRAIHDERVAEYRSRHDGGATTRVREDESPGDDPLHEVWIGEHVDNRLDEVGQALARLEGGTYGRCDLCGDPIRPERLAALPAARFCMNHQLERERQSRFG